MDIVYRTDSTKSVLVKAAYILTVIFQLGHISSGLPIDKYTHASSPTTVTVDTSRRSLESRNDYVVKFEAYIDESRWMDALLGDEEFLIEVLNNLHSSPSHNEKGSSRRKHHVKRGTKSLRRIGIACKRRTHHGKRRVTECRFEPLDPISRSQFGSRIRTRTKRFSRPTPQSYNWGT